MISFDNTKSILLVISVGFVGWKVYQASKVVDEAIESVDNTRLEIGGSIGRFIYRAIDPSDILRPRPEK